MAIKKVDVAIIGAGAAGLGAAKAAAEKGASVLVIERREYLGGILPQCIHNGFGLELYKEELTGPEMAYRLVEDLEGLGVEIWTETYVSSIDPSLKLVCLSEERGEVTVEAKAIVYAAGSWERTAGSIGLAGDRPGGIYPAGEAQLLLNIKGHLVGKKIFILGSGDVGLIMARRFSLEGAEVVAVAERNSYLGGLARNKAQCLDDFGIPLLLSTTVKEAIGKERVEAVITAKVDEKGNFIPGTEKKWDIDCLILSVGLAPYVTLLKEIGLEIGLNKGPLVDDSLMTKVPGLFAAGNSLHIHDLADMAYQEGKKAGTAAAEFSQRKRFAGKEIQVNAGQGISYVVPSKLGYNREREYEIKFRVRRPAKDSTLLISQNGKVIKKLFKLFWLPADMENIAINGKLLENDYSPIAVSLAEGRL